MRSRLLLVSAFAALSLLASAGCGKKSETPAASGAFPVGLVFDIGGRGDKSFNDAAYAGLEHAQNELGITFSTLETNEGSDREAQLRQLAAGDNKMVFGVGFLFTDDIKNLAKEFPQQKFACVDYTYNAGDTLPENLVALKFREEQGSFLVGALAALTSKTGKVGFVGGMEIPL
ncbi:MAG: BMP family ABC transporter substrate-binding protein, partial [Candidatus Eisenbacteria bacterium]|nr:BMP family ABC transporter substrate-binding protein [Candidatus Eisenbacteria bacterium]